MVAAVALGIGLSGGASAGMRSLDCLVAQTTERGPANYSQKLLIQVDYDGARRVAKVSEKFILEQFGKPISVRIELLSRGRYSLDWTLPHPISRKGPRSGVKVTMTFDEPTGRFQLRAVDYLVNAERGEGKCLVRKTPLG